MHISRNEPCFCGSRKKYKKCCLHNIPKLPSFESNFIAPLYPELDEEFDQSFSYLEDGDIANAKEIANRLMDSYSDSHIVHFVLGVCLLQEKLLEEAVASFERSVQIYPYFSEGYYNLGSLYLQTARTHKSVDCFRKIIQIEGKNSELGEKAQQELDWIERLINLQYKTSLHRYLEREKLFDAAFECLMSKKYKMSIELFHKVLEQEPDNVQSHGNLGLAYAQIGDKKTALEHLDKALSLDPTYELARVNRSIIAQLEEGEALEAETDSISYYLERIKNSEKRSARMDFADVSIGQSSIGQFVDGLGVFAKRSFKQGEVVIKWHLQMLSQEEFDQLSVYERNTFCHKRSGVIYYYPMPERYVNRSDNPNVYPDFEKEANIALRDIKCGEELSIPAAVKEDF